MKPYVLAHVSDTHVSRFGDTFHDVSGLKNRSLAPHAVDSHLWELAWSEGGFRVFVKASGPRAERETLLVDPEDYIHKPSLFEERQRGKSQSESVHHAISIAKKLRRSMDVELASSSFDAEELTSFLREDPSNVNLRLMYHARVLSEHGVSAVVHSGDMTDHGAGYPLLEKAFSPWIQKNRFFPVAGNHDVYLFPVAGSTRPKPDVMQKQVGLRMFYEAIGIEVDPSSAYVREIPEAESILVGLNSCASPQKRFFRHNGSISNEQIQFLLALSTEERWKKARHRLVVLHHHVASLSGGIGRKMPLEFGMKLDNAKDVAKLFGRIKVGLVMHGHRHISEERIPAGCNFKLLAASSFTLGCQSGEAPSYWRVELSEKIEAERVYLPVPEGCTFSSLGKNLFGAKGGQ